VRTFYASLFSALVFAAASPAEEIPVAGLERPVEVLRDRWGVPHIYAQSANDLFFAQGYIAAKDRLFQIDLFRRTGSGKLAEVFGPSMIARDTLARAVAYKGDWNAEWEAYGPDTRRIATSFTDGINAYIKSLGGKRTPEFQIAGYDPGLWVPEDCVSRIAGLLMTRNLAREVSRAMDARKFGLPTLQKYFAPDPPIALEVPRGLDLDDITADILKVYNEAISLVKFPDEPGSNNWVVDGSMTVTGKPILANDPHRPILNPSLRKTVHLVAPGWNAIGAGEPGLPGIALGHNERIGFGFTIVGIDQGDLYVEKLNPANPGEYLYKGSWKKLDIERAVLNVKGSGTRTIELRRTIHGPVIHEDRARNRAYALRWVGTEPGTAGYLAGLAAARANNWGEFLKAMDKYRVPSENVIYADIDGNIGWQAAGLTPIRKNWSGLFPVPGDTGEYEWSGFRRTDELPRAYNPAAHFIATANHNILPRGYQIPLSYEWALPFRFGRVREVLSQNRKFSVADFEKLQNDVTSLPARRFQGVLRNWKPAKYQDVVEKLVRWDGALTVDSVPAAVYSVWLTKLPAAVFGPELGPRTDLGILLQTLENEPNPKALAESLEAAMKQLGPTPLAWGKMHQVEFRHPLNRKAFHRGPFPRPGDANTVNNTGGSQTRQTSGASYRQILDLSDWDKSVMTNVPGEVGDPASPHYADLIEEWASGRYHPMPFTRKAVEAATKERIQLLPRK
jgi:penicillin amidase